jgi:hypothetical protein
VIAADAVVMQIQSWEGAAWSCAEAVREGATPDRNRPEAGCCEKRIVKSEVEEAGKGDPFRCKAERYGTGRNTPRIRIG